MTEEAFLPSFISVNNKKKGTNGILNAQKLVEKETHVLIG